MTKIIDKLNGKIAEGKSFFSFEYFPPKTDEGVHNLKERQMRMAALGPCFCDITWGAGGSTAEVTLDVARSMQQEVRAHGVLGSTRSQAASTAGGHLYASSTATTRARPLPGCQQHTVPIAAASSAPAACVNGKSMCTTLGFFSSGSHAMAMCTCVRVCNAQVGVETMMHLTCTNMPVEKLKEALTKVSGGGGMMERRTAACLIAPPPPPAPSLLHASRTVLYRTAMYRRPRSMASPTSWRCAATLPRARTTLKWWREASPAHSTSSSTSGGFGGVCAGAGLGSGLAWPGMGRGTPAGLLPRRGQHGGTENTHRATHSTPHQPSLHPASPPQRRARRLLRHRRERLPRGAPRRDCRG